MCVYPVGHFQFMSVQAKIIFLEEGDIFPGRHPNFMENLFKFQGDSSEGESGWSDIELS